jgi:hypothetical protein
MINDPSVAGKLTWRGHDSDLIVLAARDENTPMLIPLEEQSLQVELGRSEAAVVRWRRAFGEESFVGLIATARRYEEGGSGALGGIDGLWRLGRNLRVKGQVLASRTEEPDAPAAAGVPEEVTFDRGRHTVTLDGERFDGIALYGGVSREGRHWSGTLDWWHASPTFRSDNGFVVRNSEDRVEVDNSLAFYPSVSWIDKVQPHWKVTLRWNADGVRKERKSEEWIEVILKGQTMVSVGYDFYWERFRGVTFDDIRLFYLEMATRATDAFQMGFWLGLGDRIARMLTPPALGQGGHLDFWARIKPARNVTIEPILAYSRLERKDTGEEVFDGYILRTRVNWQLTRELATRVVVQYDDFTGELRVEPLVTYQLDPFTIFYVGGGSGAIDYGAPLGGFHRSDWQAFFKMQMLLRM